MINFIKIFMGKLYDWGQPFFSFIGRTIKNRWTKYGVIMVFLKGIIDKSIDAYNFVIAKIAGVQSMGENIDFSVIDSKFALVNYILPFDELMVVLIYLLNLLAACLVIKLVRKLKMFAFF